MFAAYLELVELAAIVTVLFVSAGVALWLRDWGGGSKFIRPVTLSDEARSALLRARAADLQKATAEKIAAKKLVKAAHRRAFRQVKSE